MSFAEHARFSNQALQSHRPRGPIIFLPALTESLRESCARLLRIPPDPEPPPGDESSTHRFRAAPNFFKYLFFLWMLKSVLWFLAASWIMIVPTIGAIVLIRKGHEWGWFLLLLPGAALLLFLASRAFALVVLRLDFEKRWYLVTNRSLRVREGLLLVREMTVTFANIQNISTAQGPIQRILGIADLRVDTAGGGGQNGAKHPGQNLHTAWFRGIDNANEVRELIQERLRHLKDTGLGDHSERPAATVISTTPVSPDLLSLFQEIHSEACALAATAARRRASMTRTN